MRVPVPARRGWARSSGGEGAGAGARRRGGRGPAPSGRAAGRRRPGRRPRCPAAGPGRGGGAARRAAVSGSRWPCRTASARVSASARQRARTSDSHRSSGALPSGSQRSSRGVQVGDRGRRGRRSRARPTTAGPRAPAGRRRRRSAARGRAGRAATLPTRRVRDRRKRPMGACCVGLGERRQGRARRAVRRSVRSERRSRRAAAAPRVRGRGPRECSSTKAGRGPQLRGIPAASPTLGRTAGRVVLHRQ